MMAIFASMPRHPDVARGRPQKETIMVIDPSEWHLDDDILPTSGRYWTCSTRPACLHWLFGEIDGPEYCDLCGAEGMPGAAGIVGIFFNPEGCWWECPAGCRIWFGSLHGPQHCSRCHGMAQPSHFEGTGPCEP